jgi:catechol 2,3-dioxygenase-like lactoylglutathione lyase family enzyme
MQSNPPTLNANLVMLGVADLDAALPFYTDGLGLALMQRHGGLAFLTAGAITLVLSAELRRAVPGGAPRDVELVFSVSSVRETYDALRERGIVFRNEPHEIGGGSHVANFTDHDGHLLSLYGPP